MKKHILVVSQYFYPEEFRINDICKELINRGYRVTVLTGIPNYPEGKYYDGYSFFSSNEQFEGMNIVRLPILPRGKGKLGLITNYISFVISGFIWKIFTKLDVDAVFIYQVSPITQALPGIWLGKKRKVPIILYVLDLWPENVQIVGNINNKGIIALLNKMVDYIYNNADKILTSSNSFLKRICERGSFENKLEFWPQYPEDIYFPVVKNHDNALPTLKPLQLTFAGNIGEAQGLSILPIVAKQLSEKNISVIFNIIGDGRYKQTLVDNIKKQKVEAYFNFIGRKAPKEIPYYFAESDASLIILSSNELFNMTIPAKLQSTMSCAMPIIASLNGETADIIRQSKSGFVSNAGDAEHLVDNIIKFRNLTSKEREQLGKNALSYARNFYDKTSLLDQLEQWFM